MTRQNFHIDKLRVASPCSVGWEEMTGDERVRHCSSCQLNIYNIAEMTEPEVKNLISNYEGRLCIRLFKRADGTVLTKDCPVGIRAYQKKAARFAGAALSAILGLFSISFGQKSDEKSFESVKSQKISSAKKIIQSENGSLSGKVADSAGAFIPNAELILRQTDGKLVYSTRSNAKGEFVFHALHEGNYTLEAKTKDFAISRYENIIVKNGLITELNISLQPKGTTVVVGIFADDEPLIDISSSTVKKTITRRMIDLLPH